MIHNFIEEPELQFGKDRHLCVRAGISRYDVYDRDFKSKKREIFIGAIGIGQDLEALNNWLELCANPIAGKVKIRLKNLYPPFVGFNEGGGFCARLVVADELTKKLNKVALDKILEETKNWDDRINSVVQVYYESISFLALNKEPDVIVCVIPKSFEGTIYKRESEKPDETIEDEKQEEFETDFRRALKAKCMHLAVPLQLVKAHTLKSSSGIQDDATRAWNFCTALYYKAGGTPWRMLKKSTLPSVCFVGIGFYGARDKKTIQTSVAQIFDELGNGVILRGSEVKIGKDDRQPHLDDEQSYELLKQTLAEYKVALETFPARLVMHKSSKYSDQEIRGFTEACSEFHVDAFDMVTILDAELKFFRNGMYPPFRGTHIELSPEQHILYTRGAVRYYETYPGMYVPQPLDIRIVQTNESPNVICEEILGLTKMNWNNTQFDGKYPITIACARKVGQILKYLPQGEGKPQVRYSFYM